MVLGAVLLVGCNQDLPGVVYEKPGQAEAMRTVWVDVYGMGRCAPPTVYWVEGADLGCGGDPDTFLDEDVCVYGQATTHGIAVAWSENRSPFSRGSFGHETLHWRQWVLSGDPDDDHAGPAWQPGGLLDQANAALAASGR